MARKGFQMEQIIRILRQIEVAAAQGTAVGEACRQVGIT